MTQVSAKVIIENLREKIKTLKDQIEAVKKAITHSKDTYQDMPLGLERMLDELLKILEDK